MISPLLRTTGEVPFLLLHATGTSLMSCADTGLRRTIVRCLTVLSNFFSYIQNYSGDLNSLVALHELYKYINKYYDQVSVWFQQV